MKMEHGYGRRAEADEVAEGGVFDCEEAIHTLYHFLDGELTIERRLEIQQHLEGCSPCLEAFDFEAELRLVIARKCRDMVPPSLLDRVSRALSEASGSAPGSEESGGMSNL
jgi:mycothiol system anti-sigma-R factor